MDFHLERGLRLNTEPKHKNLYNWAINEIDAQGRRVGDDTLHRTSKIATPTCALPPIIGRGLEVNRHLTRTAFWAAESVGQAPNREISPPGPQQRFHVEVDAGADALHPVTLASHQHCLGSSDRKAPHTGAAALLKRDLNPTAGQARWPGAHCRAALAGSDERIFSP